jgi:hypothetical protein
MIGIEIVDQPTNDGITRHNKPTPTPHIYIAHTKLYWLNKIQIGARPTIHKQRTPQKQNKTKQENCESQVHLRTNQPHTLKPLLEKPPPPTFHMHK